MEYSKLFKDFKMLYQSTGYQQLSANKLVSEIIAKGKSGIDGCLWKSSGYGKLRERVVVEKQCVQALAQGIIGCKLERP
tara:strand:+ start:1843 stop:2079 length:237 start_codon:yes stop_codon:yes gene_type:complete